MSDNKRIKVKSLSLFLFILHADSTISMLFLYSLAIVLLKQPVPNRVHKDQRVEFIILDAIICCAPDSMFISPKTFLNNQWQETCSCVM